MAWAQRGHSDNLPRWCGGGGEFARKNESQPSVGREIGALGRRGAQITAAAAAEALKSTITSEEMRRMRRGGWRKAVAMLRSSI